RTASTTPPTESKKFLEDTAETGKDVLKTAKSLETGILQPIVTITVIETTLFRIMQHFVRLRCLLKFFLGFRIIRITVRMILKRQLAIAFFNLVFGGCACYAKDLVVIPFGHSIASPSGLSLSAPGVIFVLPRPR